MKVIQEQSKSYDPNQVCTLKNKEMMKVETSFLIIIKN